MEIGQQKKNTKKAEKKFCKFQLIETILELGRYGYFFIKLFGTISPICIKRPRNAFLH